MGGLFSMDNAFFTTVGKLFDIIVISFIWFLLCLPIVTIGPATTALYYTIVKVVRRERGYLLREFFNSFKSNFKTGALAGITLTVMFIVLLTDVSVALGMGGIKGMLFLSIFGAMMFLLVCVTIYIFPILSRFSIGFKKLMKTALFMSIKHLPTTILMVVIVAACILGTFILPLLIFISPASCCLLCSLLLERVLKKYMPEKSGNAELTGKDEWYLE